MKVLKLHFMCLMNLKKGIEVYLQWKSSYASIAASRYCVRLRGFKEYLGKETSLKSITGEQVTHYHLFMEKQYSAATVAYSARILKNFFDFWKERGEAKLNPKEIIPARFISPDKEAVTQEDLEDMCDLLDEGYFDDLVKKLTLNLLWDTGMRVSELCDIKIEQIKKNEANNLWYAKVRSRKSMRYNLVVWSKTTNDLLTKYLSIRLGMDASNDHLIIGSKRTGKGITTRTVQRWIKKLAADAMLDKAITPHSFRHGKAHDMLDQGANIRDVQAILRHVMKGTPFLRQLFYVIIN